MQESDLQALERFVAENEELLQLEDRISKFNIFDALRLERVEIRHSNFLAWLLTPTESHGQNDAFLKALLMDLLRHARSQGVETGLNAAEIDGEDIGFAEVRREDGHTDLLLAIPSPPCVVCIENKMHSSERPEKLRRYVNHVSREFPSSAKLFVFLNPEGADASDENWIAYSYADVYRVVKRVRELRNKTIGQDVATFIDHYLSLLESKFMNDAKIQELCRRIYANHRQAIDLIVANTPGAASEGLDPIKRCLAAHPETWILRGGNAAYVYFVPTHWQRKICDAAGRPLQAAACDVFLEAQTWSGDDESLVAVRVVIGPGRDSQKRLAIIDKLVSPQIGFSMQRKKAADKFTRLDSKTLIRWSTDSECPSEQLVNEFEEWTKSIAKKLTEIPAVVLSE